MNKILFVGQCIMIAINVIIAFLVLCQEGCDKTEDRVSIEIIIYMILNSAVIFGGTF